MAIAPWGDAYTMKDARLQKFRIGSMAIDLPSFLETRIEDDTLVAFPPRTDFANLRFDVVSVSKDGAEVAGAGEEMIREGALEAGAQLCEDRGRVWYHVIEPASEGSAGSLMHYWYVGLGGHSLVVSCFVDAAESSHPLTQSVLASVQPAIDSFRRDTK
jgi:hypothetical protein